MEILYDIILVLVGLSIPYIIKTFIFLYNRVSGKDIMKGKWYVYHYTYENNRMILRKEVWEINPSLMQYKINTSDEKRPDLLYKGNLRITRHDIRIEMSGKGFNENYSITLNPIIPNKDNIYYGISTGRDFDHNKIASVHLFSKNDDDEKAKRMLEEKISESNKLLIRI